VLCQAPPGLAGDALFEALAEVAEAAPTLMLQDLDFGGGGLAIETILGLAERIPQLKCIKLETVPAGPKYTALLEATGGRMHVSGGWAVGQMIDALDRGVHAFMPTELEDVWVKIHGLHREGRRDEARAGSTGCCRSSPSPTSTSTSASASSSGCGCGAGCSARNSAVRRCRRSTSCSSPRPTG
jgi:hypothetical protein